MFICSADSDIGTTFNFQLMNNIINTDELDIDYTLIYKDRDLILDDCNFSDDDRLICDSIIDNLETEVAKQVKLNKTVSIPMIGTIEPNWYRKTFKEKSTELKEYKNTHTKEEYDKYFKDVCNSIKQDRLDKEQKAKAIKQFKAKVLPRYIKLCTEKSVIYANAWLAMTSKLSVVEFDPEIEEVYERFRLGLDAND